MPCSEGVHPLHEPCGNSFAWREPVRDVPRAMHYFSREPVRNGTRSRLASRPGSFLDAPPVVRPPLQPDERHAPCGMPYSWLGLFLAVPPVVRPPLQQVLRRGNGDRPY